MAEIRPVRRLVVLALVVLFGLFVAAPATAQTDTTQPPAPTEAPATTSPPATEAPSTTVAPSDGDDELTAGTLVLLIVVGLAIAAIIGAVFAGRGQDQSAPAATSPKRDLLANVRWLHDQLSVYLLSGPGPQSSVQWQADRYRVQTMAATAEGYSRGEAGGAWHRLSVAISDVIAALDSATALRADPNADPAAVSQAIGVVNQNRALLMQSAEVAGRTIA